MSITSIFRKPERYTNYDPESPASRAQQRWDEREGQIIVQNYNLRRLAFGLMGVIVLLAGGLVYKSVTSSAIPYVVLQDRLTGEVVNVGTASSMRNYKPGERIYKYFLSQLVKNVREVPLDQVVYRNNLVNAFSFLTKDAASKMETILKSENYAEKLKNKTTVQVEIVSVLPMDGGKSYQVQWNEEEFNRGSNAKTVTPYTGIFTVSMIESDDEATLAINPLGLYVEDFSMSKAASALNATKKTNE